MTLMNEIQRASSIAAQLRKASVARPEERLDPYERAVLRRYRETTSDSQQWADAIEGKDLFPAPFDLSEFGLTAESTTAEFASAYEKLRTEPTVADLRAKLKRRIS